MKLPQEAIQNETKTKVSISHSYFHIDVIKRAIQNILKIKDHFSSYQDAMLIPSKKAEDLKQGIIILSSGLRHPNMIHISPEQFTRILDVGKKSGQGATKVENHLGKNR